MTTKYDELRESGKRKRLTYRAEEPRDPAQHELWRLENMIEDGRLTENGELTSFEKWLLDELLHRCYDPCAICAKNPGWDQCAAVLPDGEIDDDMCRLGIRELFTRRLPRQ